MINQLEIPMYLEDAIQEFSHDLVLNSKANAYGAMNTLTTFTSENIETHNYNVVKRCFLLADKLYSKGNGVVKNAVEIVFVFSFTRMFNNFPAERKQLLAMLPVTLYSVYITQVCHCGS
jgi:hypothetical protein